MNLSHLRCNHSKGIRISLLEDLCRELHCQPGDLLVYEPARSRGAGLTESADVDETPSIAVILKRYGKDS